MVAGGCYTMIHFYFPVAAGMIQPRAICILKCHSSSSSSIFSVGPGCNGFGCQAGPKLEPGGGLGSLLELPNSAFSALMWLPRLCRTPSSRPGRLARCFLNGLAIAASFVVTLGAAGVTEPNAGDAEAEVLPFVPAAVVVAGGIPLVGLLLEIDALRASSAATGSAEC